MSEENKLQRGLKARHMNMIAIGGAIGTGLFVASGASISEAGPGGALVAYGAIGVMVYFLMQSLGEMATFMPISGSFQTYATRFISPSFGFAMGWNYWYNWAITVAAELAAAAIVMKYWFPGTPAWVWSLLFIVILFCLNIFSAKAFGEGEFWFAGIKVVTIVIFLIVGILMIIGVLGGGAPGFSNWVVKDAPFAGGFLAIMNIFMIAGFSFQGTELIGIAAGEAEHPEKNVPKAIRTVFFRIMLFYIGAIVVIGFVLPYTDPRLLGGGIENIAVSPFTLIFEKAGILGAATVMNAVILTSILSCGNSGLYAASRMLYAMAVEGKAPKLFSKVNKHGVPANAVYLTTLVGMGCFLTSLVGTGTAYVWLVNASGLAGFIAWVGIAWCHYNFRRAYVMQGKNLDDLKFKAKWFPLGPLLALVLCIIVILGQNYGAFIGKFDLNGILVAYIGLPFVLILWAGHKIVTKSKKVDLMHADFSLDIVNK